MNPRLSHHAVMDKSVRAILVMLGSIIATCLWAGENAPSGLPLPLTSAIQVRRLSLVEAWRGDAVHIKGVVTYADLDWNMLFIQDSTGGVYVNSSSLHRRLLPGDMVEVDGFVDPGAYNPFVSRARVILTGKGVLPKPPLRSLRALARGEDDGNWVEFKGTVRSTTVEGGHLLLHINEAGDWIKARVPLSGEDDQQTLVNAKVRVQGVCAVSANERRELAEVQLFVPGRAFVIVETPPPKDAFTFPIRKIVDILNHQGTAAETNQVRVQGVVQVNSASNWFLISDRTGGVRIETAGTNDFEPGLLVDVVGSRSERGATAVLTDVTVRRIGIGNTNEFALTNTKASSGNVLTTVQQIRALTPEEAVLGHPVNIHGVVTYYDQDWGTLFVQDSTAGIFVSTQGHRFDLDLGQSIELEGVTAPGDFAPMIANPRFQILGHAPLPLARPYSLKELDSGTKDSQWLQMDGIVHSVEVQNGRATLDVVDGEGHFTVLIPNLRDKPTPADMIDTKVRLVGVCGTIFNQRRQLVGVDLFVPSFEFITSERSAPVDPFSLPVRSINSLLRFTTAVETEHRLRVQGTITFWKPKEFLYLQDETGGLLVKADQTQTVAIGDRLDVVGFESKGTYTPALTHASFRKLAAGQSPTPVTVTAEQALSADWDKDIFDAKLVRVRGRLLDLAIRSTEKTLLLQQGTVVFSASLTDEATSQFYSSLRVGSLLDLTGVCSVQVDDNRNPKSFRIYLRSPADITVRELGPWWSLEHTIELAAIAGTLVLLTMGWIAMLRRRVQAQTQLIQQRLEREQVLEVRYRELFESNPHSMWVYDKETLTFLAVNDAAVHHYGYTRDEFLRMTIKDIRPATELDALMKKLEVIRDQGIEKGTRWKHHKRNGTIIDVEASSHQLVFAGREAKLVLVIDITERLRAENALRESEESFRDLFENATDLIQSLNPDGTFAYVNRAWLRALKYEPEEVAGLTFQTLVHPDHLSECRALFQRVQSGEKHDRFEAVFVGKDGSSIAVEGSCNCKFHDGKPISIRGIFRDVTERKRKEEELRHTRVFLNSVVDNLPIIVFIKEAEELRFVRWNKAGEELLGYSNDEMIGKNDYDFFPQEEANYFTAKDRETLEKGQLVEIEEEAIKTRHRGVRLLRTKKLPILGETGKPAYLLGISEDITERKRAEAELEKAHRDLVEVSRQAGMAEVATGVLHNVGNVLNSVNVSSNLVADNLKKSKAPNLSKAVALLREHALDLGAFITSDPKGKQLPEYLAQLAEHLAGEQAAALRELAHLQKNIEHIKEIVAMQQSYANISGVTETVQVSDLVDDALRMNGSALVRHDVEAIREFEAVPPITVEKHKMLQILVNLIRNAKHACDATDRPDKRLTVRVTNGDNRVRIAVIDNGIGIPPENLTRIFNHGFTTRKDGHGFGLHSGALAAKELGGVLNVRSEGVGKGAMFILELPLERARNNYV